MSLQRLDVDSIVVGVLAVLLGAPLIQFLVHVLRDEERTTSAPPRGVIRATQFDLLWGYGLLFFSVLGVVFDPRRMSHVSLYLLGVSSGILWAYVAVLVRRANRRARALAGLLSVLRVFTVIGIPISCISLYGLYFSPGSRDFFSER